MGTKKFTFTLLSMFLGIFLFSGSIVLAQSLTLTPGTLYIGPILTGQSSLDGKHSFQVTGSGYTAGDQIFADSPDTDFTISLTGTSGTYTSSLIFYADGSGNVNQTIYVKFTPSVKGQDLGQIEVYEFVTFVWNYKDVNGIGQAPEMLLEGRPSGSDPYAEVVSGSTTPETANGTDFGNALYNTETVDRTFQITNDLPTGGLNGDLVLSEYTTGKYVEITGSGASHFSVTTEPSTPVSTPYGSTTFTIRFAPTSYGVKTATVTIGNNDTDENPYTFVIQGKGTVTAPGTPTADAATQIDNNSFFANWTPGTGGPTDGYFLDVSTDNLFLSFIPGYENRNVGNVTSYQVTGLSANTDYYFRVRAYNIGDTSAYSNTQSLTTAPEVPVVQPASNVDATSLYANWTYVSGATSYRFDMNTSPDFTGTVIYNDQTVTNNYIYVTGLTPNTTYYYRVRSYNGNASENSGVVSVVTLCAAPTATAATNINFDSFTANWNPPTGGTPDYYKLDVSTSNLFNAFVSGYQGLTVNGTSQSVTGLDPNTMYYYRVRAVNVTGESNNSNTIQVTTYSGSSTTTWTGSVSTNWNTSGNWSDGIPSSVTSATIPAVTNQPVVSGTFSCNNLTLEPAAQLTVNSGSSLTVNGNLLMQANSSGEASILEYGGLAVSGTTQVQQFLEGSRWHFISYPTSLPNSSVYESLFLRYWDEATNGWTYIVNPDSSLNVGQGFSAFTQTATGDTTITYDAGSLNQGTYSLPVAFSGSGNGWNVVGNPYPSAIDWDDPSWTKTNIDASIYVWDGTQYLVWNGIFGDLTDGVIPAMQGFYVKASASGPALQVSDAARVHGPSAYKNGEVSNLIRVHVTGNGYHDVAYIYFNEDATAGFDSDYDAFKLFGIEEAPQIYSIVGDDILAINTLPELYPGLSIPLGLKVGNDAVYDIRIDNLNSFETPVSVYIEDLQTGDMFEMTDNESVSLMAGAKDEPGRLMMHFMTLTGTDESVAEPVSVYSFGNSVYVRNAAPGATVQITSVTGQLVYSGETNGENLFRIDTRVSSGYYIVKVISDHGVTTEKVFLK